MLLLERRKAEEGQVSPPVVQILRVPAYLSVSSTLLTVCSHVMAYCISDWSCVTAQPTLACANH